MAPHSNRSANPSQPSAVALRCARLGRSAAIASALLLSGAACEQSASKSVEQDAPAVATAAPSVVAKLGDQPISLAEVDAQVMKSEMAVIQELYDARRRAITQLVEQQLLDQEAKKLGLTRELLLLQEVDGKAPEVTDADIKAFYDENKDAIGEETLEQISPRIRTFLAQRGVGDRRRSYVAELKEKAGFEVFLEPPRHQVTVAADEPAKGPADAPITIVEYSDFECPFCVRVMPTLQQVIDEYGDKVRLVYRDYPLPMHPNAQLAAEAAQCAHAQGKFWEYHDTLFANQVALGVDSLKQYAAALKLDQAAFDTCLDQRTHQAGVLAETRDGNALGVTGTPAFFINGRFVNGALPIEMFKEVIDDELERK